MLELCVLLFLGLPDIYKPSCADGVEDKTTATEL